MKLTQEIKDLLKLHALQRRLKTTATTTFYIATTKPNELDEEYLIKIGYEKEDFIDYNNDQKYNYYQTNALNYLLHYETTTNQIRKIKLLYKLTVALLIEIYNINLKEHIAANGLTEEQYNKLINYEENEVQGIHKIHTRTTILATFNLEEKININYFDEDNLIKKIRYGGITDEYKI